MRKMGKVKDRENWNKGLGGGMFSPAVIGEIGRKGRGRGRKRTPCCTCMYLINISHRGVYFYSCLCGFFRTVMGTKVKTILW